MSLLFSLAAFTPLYSLNDGALHSIVLKLAPSVTLNIKPSDTEVKPLVVSLAEMHSGSVSVNEFQFPVAFASPTRAIYAKLSGAHCWLVLGTEDTVMDSLSFCLEVSPDRHMVNLLFSDHSGVKEKTKLLRNGIFQEENLQKWIIPGHVNDAQSDDLLTRKGIFDAKMQRVVFGLWTRKRT